MQKNMATMIIAALLAGAGSAWSVHNSGLLIDGGFETLDWTWPAYEPSSTSEPWFTTTEDNEWGFSADTNRSHSGAQSVVFQAYWDQGSIVQTLTNQIDSSKNYYFSAWMLTDELNSDPALTNAPSVWVSLSTSLDPAGPYTYRKGIFWATTNSATHVWEQVGGMVNGSELSKTRVVDPEWYLDKILEQVRLAYAKGVVHGDLSEFCIAQWEVAVDFLQLVEKSSDAFIMHRTQGRP